jgi:hypothetical protein
MRFFSPLALSALLALGWSSFVSAEGPGSAPSVGVRDAVLEADELADAPEPEGLASLTRMELDSALEEFVARDKTDSLQSPSGPTQMACRNGAVSEDLETCTVTAGEAPSPPLPAALAQQ